MTIETRSRRRVDGALATLHQRWGVDRTVETRWAVPPAGYDRTAERFAAGTVGGAGAWVARDDGAVLLVRERDSEGWGEPAGKHEPGEAPAATARREVREETGLAVELDHVALAQRAVHVDRTDDARPPIHRLVVVFAARRAGGTARPREDGVEAVRWVRDHPDELLYPALAELPIPPPWY